MSIEYRPETHAFDDAKQRSNLGISVSDVNDLVKESLEDNLILQNLTVQGEISNLRYYSQAGHYYFTLSDKDSSLNCVVYASFVGNMKCTLANGLQVFSKGKIRVFHKRGQYSFQIAYLSEAGKGDLSAEFEKLKSKLLGEGLFDEDRKKNIPQLPQRIGLLTAFDSAAMWDFVRVAHENAPHLDINVIPSIVQGPKAPDSLIRNLNALQGIKTLDIIVIMRGGGSAEDLACFNHEGLVRTVANASLPTISAVGHEIDYCLTDFASDLRVPTPTAAAHRIADPFPALKRNIQDTLIALSEKLSAKAVEKRTQIKTALSSGTKQIGFKQEKLAEKLDVIHHRLTMANPLHKLKQGFSICRRLEGTEIVRSTKAVKKGDLIQTEVEDGTFKSTVI